MEHGYAKLARGADSFSTILHALGAPEPSLLSWATILVELLGGFAVLIGAFIPDALHSSSQLNTPRLRAEARRGTRPDPRT
jgi:DoxX